MRDLQADLEICNKATPGPWYGLKNAGVFTDTEYEKPVFETGCGCCTQATLKTDDAQFIATAREGWPEAIERAIKAEEQVVKLQLTLQEIASPIKFLKQRADEQGAELNGLLALDLATDAGYIKGIAKKALAEQEATLPYGEMIAEASRKADSQLSALREENELQRHSIQELSKQVVRLQAERDICGKWPVRIGEYFCGAEIVGADYKRKTVTIEWRAIEVQP